MRILVTGAAGFIGRACCAHFAQAGADVVAAVRRAAAPAIGTIEVGEVGARTDWSRALEGVDAIVHLVAVTHGRDIAQTRAYPRYREVNVAGTRALAEQARRAGVRRFVYLSSIKVNGEAVLAPGAAARPYAVGDRPAPQDNYGRSKWEAEQCLQAMAAPGGFEPVILRPPLVYGPGQKANLLRLMQWVDAGYPLPFARVDNRRSLIYVGNLADALYSAATVAVIPAQALPIADVDLSTADLIRAMATALAVTPRLVPCPAAVFRVLALHALGRALVLRLCGSLLIDAGAAREALGWTPEVPLHAAMRATAAWYRARMPR